MLGPLGAIRWLFRPIDKAIFASAALTGALLSSPRILLNTARVGRRKALSMRSLWDVCDATPLGHYTFAGNGGRRRRRRKERMRREREKRDETRVLYMYDV